MTQNPEAWIQNGLWGTHVYNHWLEAKCEYGAKMYSPRWAVPQTKAATHIKHCEYCGRRTDIQNSESCKGCGAGIK